MRMSKHTKEPWRVIKIGSSEHPVVRAEELDICDCWDHGNNMVPGKLEGEANAQRIVDCVNALEGLNPAAIKEVVKALENLVEVCPCQNGCDPADMSCATMRARTALANIRSNK